jgi:hypothetical protein
LVVGWLCGMCVEVHKVTINSFAFRKKIKKRLKKNKKFHKIESKNVFKV